MPAEGYRDIPSECSGGDFDGDDFSILYDKRLIPNITIYCAKKIAAVAAMIYPGLKFEHK